jgi:cytochrome c peroxidase
MLALALASAPLSVPVQAGGGDSAKESFRRPMTVPMPEEAPYSPQLATLGKMLFFDPRLSGDQNINCVTCHNPSFGFETPVSRAVGASGNTVARHAPTVLNMAWSEHFFWDGRASSLEEQAASPIESDKEMGGDFGVIISRLGMVEEYERWFDRLFPDEGLNRNTILKALAAYQRTIVAGWSPFDRWVAGDEYAIPAEAVAGFKLFTGKAGCANCHSGWNFTDGQFHDIGLYDEDIGRAGVDPKDPKARYAFKTPSLRNISYRAPYMHHGLMTDLEQVIDHFANGGIERASRSDLMQPFELDDTERRQLVAFLHSLTAEKTKTAMPILPN